jgi:hypothetical protein
MDITQKIKIVISKLNGEETILIVDAENGFEKGSQRKPVDYDSDGNLFYKHIRPGEGDPDIEKIKDAVLIGLSVAYPFSQDGGGSDVP